MGLGSLIWGVGLALFGIAEAIVNTAVGLYQPIHVWAFTTGVYALGGLAIGIDVGLGAWIIRRLPFAREWAVAPLIMALFLAGYLFVFVGLPLNDRYLPGFFEPVSLMTNGGVGLLCAALGLAVFFLLSRREGGRLALSFVNIALWWCIFLSAGMYIDMYIGASSEGGGTMGYYGSVLVGCVVAYVLIDLLVVRASAATGAAAAVILGVAFFVSRFVAELATKLLGGMGFDGVPARLGLSQAVPEGGSPSSFVGKLIVFFVMLFAVVESANVENGDAPDTKKSRPYVVVEIEPMVSYAGEVNCC